MEWVCARCYKPSVKHMVPMLALAQRHADTLEGARLVYRDGAQFGARDVVPHGLIDAVARASHARTRSALCQSIA